MNKDKSAKFKSTNSDINALCEAVIKLRNTEEVYRFFRDLLTEKELTDFGQRWRVAKMLAQKNLYSKIEQEIGMSSTTIARVNKWLKKGMGGYKIALERLESEQ